MPRRSRLSDGRKQPPRPFNQTPIEPNPPHTVYIHTVRLIPTSIFVIAIASILGCDRFITPLCYGPTEPPAPIANLHSLTPRLISGALPDRRTFHHLASLNVRTIISVDGAPPDVDAANAHNIRTVHIPVGYDGITAEQATQIIAAVRDSPGPVFIHCHHGQHRGPTAAALCMIALNDWTAEQSLNWMRTTARTGSQYAGLYDTVARFTPPTEAQLDAIDTAALPARAEPNDTVQTMLAIDRNFDNLKKIRKANWQLADDLKNQSLFADTQLLRDHFDHLRRQNPNAPADYREALNRSIVICEQMTVHLNWISNGRGSPEHFSENLETAYTTLRRTCITCHRAHRN